MKNRNVAENINEVTSRIEPKKIQKPQIFFKKRFKNQNICIIDFDDRSIAFEYSSEEDFCVLLKQYAIILLKMSGIENNFEYELLQKTE